MAQQSVKSLPLPNHSCSEIHLGKTSSSPHANLTQSEIANHNVCGLHIDVAMTILFGGEFGNVFIKPSNYHQSTDVTSLPVSSAASFHSPPLPLSSSSCRRRERSVRDGRSRWTTMAAATTTRSRRSSSRRPRSRCSALVNSPTCW